MPMYEYRCAHCGKRFEVLQKFSDAPLTVHPECGSGPVERLISAPAFNFKGTGWYVTDYAKGNGAKPDGAASPAKGEGKSEGKGEGKSESKAEGKSDSKSESSGSAPAASAPSTPAPAVSGSSSDKSDK